MIVRDARPEEKAAVADLRAEAYHAQRLLEINPAYESTLRALGVDGTGDVLVVEEDGALIGTVMLIRPGARSEVAAGPDDVEVRAFAVAPGHQGRGVGRALMKALTARALEWGARRLVLSTRPEMRAAQRLYTTMGFVRTPERDWSPVPGLDLLTYQLPLEVPERDAGGR
ncbi:GNAT family N-acetyltransferase [Nocardiopsis sp. MG754419]|uniref:GNAT family N-acetyltransferase n=1 Tax=Nocardiopsis sp. MG754419 TaxID=2259865 RepID=UPI001BAC98AB|nr:GNAT family N-acetyltransferase [Nocardiopsis sp. MG754419]MBR8745101.1 GNAT family N-acetyltransferase [Nocardiopsis sp. MG754419]